MRIIDHIDALAQQGEVLATAADRVGLAAAVPSCPGWTVRDLVRHTGGVHRWAATHVRDAVPELIQRDLEELVGGWPADDVLIAWFRRGHADLVAALRAAPADLRCATFLPADSPLAMWARRQAHETTIHRIDAELAAGATTPIASGLATDGIDELLTAFVTRPGRGPRREAPYVLAIRPTDAQANWSVAVSTGDVHVRQGTGDDADLAVSGPAAELYLLLWNRGGPDDLELTGDVSLLDHWRTQVQVRWS